MSKGRKQKAFIDYELPTQDLEQVRGGRGPITTMATGEEGGGGPTTMATGEESGSFTTLAIG
jgi:hypothetical protein